jgi:hypothetical protein
MAAITITNVSINDIGDNFQGKVDFDLNCTPTEARLNVGFKINLAAQLNFNAIDYGSDGLIEWCKKRCARFDEYEVNHIASKIACSIKENYLDYELSSEAWEYLQRADYFVFDELLERVTPVNYYKALITDWNLTNPIKEQLVNLSVIYSDEQSSSNHAIEFSIAKDALINWDLKRLETEEREEFLALAAHQLDVWLSAELDWGNANTEGRFQYGFG